MILSAFIILELAILPFWRESGVWSAEDKGLSLLRAALVWQDISNRRHAQLQLKPEGGGRQHTGV
jgi:hypothetical protein